MILSFLRHRTMRPGRSSREGWTEHTYLRTVAVPKVADTMPAALFGRENISMTCRYAPLPGPTQAIRLRKPVIGVLCR